MYDHTIEINPSNADTFLNKRMKFLFIFRNNEAIIMYDRAIQINPNYSKAYTSKGKKLDLIFRNSI